MEVGESDPVTEDLVLAALSAAEALQAYATAPPLRLTAIERLLVIVGLHGKDTHMMKSAGDVLEWHVQAGECSAVHSHRTLFALTHCCCSQSGALSEWDLDEDRASFIAKKLWKRLRRACRRDAESAANCARLLSGLLSLPAFTSVAHQGSVNGADALLRKLARRLAVRFPSHPAGGWLHELASRFAQPS